MCFNKSQEHTIVLESFFYRKIVGDIFVNAAGVVIFLHTSINTASEHALAVFIEVVNLTISVLGFRTKIEIAM